MLKIYIVNNNSDKEELLKNNSLTNPIKIYTITELENIYPYKYDNKTIDYIMNKYNVILEVANIYLKCITNYRIEIFNNDKGLFLNELKKDLIDNKLLVLNTTFINYLNNNEVYTTTIERKKNKEYFSLINNIKYIKKDVNNYPLNIYKVNANDEQIVFIGEQIVSLLNKGITPNNIFISNILNEDKIHLKTIFNLLNIPLELNNDTLIHNTSIGNIFLKELKNNSIEDSIKIVENKITSNEEADIYNEIITICNKHKDEKNIKEFIKYDIQHTKVKHKTIKDTVKEINILNSNIKDNDYIFVINANQSIFPKDHKDDEYITDEMKQKLRIETSFELNEIESNYLKNKLLSIKNLIITYNPDYPIANILEDENIHDAKILYNISNKYNKVKLSTLLDEYKNYNTITPLLEELESIYKIPYNTYDNKYKTISKELLPKDIHLSYTKLNTYQACPFSYYLKYILKVDENEDTFNISLGNLFHKILELHETSKIDIEKTYNSMIKEKTYSYKEKFFFEKEKKELIRVINTIDEQKKETTLNKTLVETKINLKINEHTTFDGIIDKIIYNNHTLAVIDYKTGDTSIKKSYMPLGFSLQLPIYLYLIKKNPNTTNFNIAGIYLQNIIAPRINYKEKESLEKQLKKNLKLKGYTNKDFNILQELDINYQDSKLIESLKVKQDNEFYKYSKVLDNEDYETIIQLVENKIKETIDGIDTANFTITSKIIDNIDNISCKYCKYQSICNKTPKDIIYLTSDNKFLESE